MAHINLLPWREERRQQQKVEYFIMLGLGAVVALILFALFTMQVNGQIKFQKSRNAYLEQEIRTLDRQIKELKGLEETKSKLIERQKIIEELQASRTQMVHLFDSLVRTIPEGTRLTSIKQAGELLTIKGRAQSFARVATYERNLEGSEWLHSPELLNIDSVPDAELTSFKLKFTLAVKLRNNTNEEDSEEELDQ
ncbi:MAG: PilN domain-containing protein [bacterium]